MQEKGAAVHLGMKNAEATLLALHSFHETFQKIQAQRAQHLLMI